MHSSPLSFNTDDWPRGSQCPELEDYDCKNNQFPIDPEIVRDLLLPLDPYKSMCPDGIHPIVSKNCYHCKAKRNGFCSMSFWNPERSQVTGSWFSRRPRRTLENTGLSVSLHWQVKLWRRLFWGYWKTPEGEQSLWSQPGLLHETSYFIKLDLLS